MKCCHPVRKYNQIQPCYTLRQVVDPKKKITLFKTDLLWNMETNAGILIY